MQNVTLTTPNDYLPFSNTEYKVRLNSKDDPCKSISPSPNSAKKQIHVQIFHVCSNRPKLPYFR